jgi:hypothetical protein
MEAPSRNLRAGFPGQNMKSKVVGAPLTRVGVGPPFFQRSVSLAYLWVVSEIQPSPAIRRLMGYRMIITDKRLGFS